MRTDRRYSRVRDMLLDPSVPRLANGGVALCHFCQRDVYFRNGLLPLLVRDVVREAKAKFRGRIDLSKAVLTDNEDAAYEAFMAMRWAGGLPVCPSCASNRSQAISTRRVWRCKDCGKQYSVTTGTVFASRKMAFADIMKLCANLDLTSRALAPSLASFRRNRAQPGA